MGSLKPYPVEEDSRTEKCGSGTSPGRDAGRADSAAAENKEKAG